MIANAPSSSKQTELNGVKGKNKKKQWELTCSTGYHQRPPREWGEYLQTI